MTIGKRASWVCIALLMMTILFFFAAGAARPDHQHESRKNREFNEFLDELQNEHVAGEDLIDGFFGIVSNSRAETDLEADLNVHAREDTWGCAQPGCADCKAWCGPKLGKNGAEKMCNGWAKNACGGCLFCPGATRPPTAVPKALNEVTCSSEVLARRAISDAYGEGSNFFHGPKLLRFIFHDGVDYNNTVDVDGNPVTSESSGVDFCLHAGRKQWGQMEERQAHHSDPTHNQNLQSMYCDKPPCFGNGFVDGVGFLNKLQDILPTGAKHISLPDLTVLATVVFIEELGKGPRIPLKWGRSRGECPEWICVGTGSSAAQACQHKHRFLNLGPKKFYEDANRMCLGTGHCDSTAALLSKADEGKTISIRQRSATSAFFNMDVDGIARYPVFGAAKPPEVSGVKIVSVTESSPGVAEPFGKVKLSNGAEFENPTRDCSRGGNCGDMRDNPAFDIQKLGEKNREIFAGLGYNATEYVALMGAHTYGRQSGIAYENFEVSDDCLQENINTCKSEPMCVDPSKGGTAMNLKELVAGPSRMGADTELSTGGMAFDHTPGAFDTDYFKELRPADGGFSYLTQNTAERHKGDASQSYTSNETSKFLPFRSCRKVYAEYGGGPNLDDREFTCRSTCGCFPLKGTVQGGFTCNDGSAIDASIKGCGSAQCQSAAKSAGKCAGSTCSDAELDDWAKAKHDNKLPEGHPPVSLESGICPMAAGQATRLIAGHTIEETRAKIEAGASKLAANPSAYKTPVRCKRLCTDELKYCTHVPATITDAVGPKVSVKSMKTLTKWNGVHMRLGDWQRTSRCMRTP